MKILVCISKTPDTTAKIAFTDNNTKFAQAGVQWIINPYDEWYALVRAIELKEKDASVTIHLITVAGADADPIIRKALALGGDEAIRVNADSQDSFYIASQMAARTKPLKVVEPVAADVLTSYVSFELPPAKAGVKLIPADNAAELVRLLHEEAKVF